MSEPLAYWCEAHERIADGDVFPDKPPRCDSNHITLDRPCKCIPLVPQTWLHTLDMSTDSVHLLNNGDRAKVLVIVDVTPLDAEQQKTFFSRALVALTRMGQKLVERRNQN